MKSLNIPVIRTVRLWVSLRIYGNWLYGKRKLGSGRMAYDFGIVSLIVERWI